MKWLTVAFGIFIIAIIVMADRGAMPHLISRVYDVPFGDKAGHFVLYGIMTFLLDLTFLRSLPKRDPKLVVFAISLILAGLIAVEEYSQQFFPDRTFSLVDLSFSYLGVAIFSWLALRIKS
jgi:polysaccharide biosynthesis protein VpsQ